MVYMHAWNIWSFVNIKSQPKKNKRKNVQLIRSIFISRVHLNHTDPPPPTPLRLLLWWGDYSLWSLVLLLNPQQEKAFVTCNSKPMCCSEFQMLNLDVWQRSQLKSLPNPHLLSAKLEVEGASFKHNFPRRISHTSHTIPSNHSWSRRGTVELCIVLWPPVAHANKIDMPLCINWQPIHHWYICLPTSSPSSLL